MDWTRDVVASFDCVLIATNHACFNYSELAQWAGCIVDVRNAMSGVPTKPGQLAEDALQINAAAQARHKIQVVRQTLDSPAISAERHKVLQILVNLIRNAKDALKESWQPDKRLVVKVARDQTGGHHRRLIARRGAPVFRCAANRRGLSPCSRSPAA